MKLFKRILIIALFGIILLTLNSTVNAASASIKTNKTSMQVGDKATITISISKAASWNLHVSGAVTKAIVGYTDDGENTSKSQTITFRPSKKGDYTISLSGDVTDGNTFKATNISANVKIKVSEKTSTNNTNSKLSTDATLKNLGITPHDFSGFKKATTSYSVTVPNDVEKISIYAEKTDSKATVTGTGSKNLKVGKNTFYVKVTAEDKKTTKTYTINITRKEKQESNTNEVNNENQNNQESPEKLSNDATLKNLGIRPKEFDFSGFKRGVTSYSIEVPNDIDTITIYAYSNDDKASVSGTGSKKLKEGVNTFSIKVTAEDKKTTKTYTLEVTRLEGERIEEKNIPDEVVDNSTEKKEGITNIKIEGYEFSPSFDVETYEYNLKVANNTQSLNIQTEVSSNDYEVELIGNENFNTGENVVTILVRNAKLDKTDTYQIIVTVDDSKNDLSFVNKLFNGPQRKEFLQKGATYGGIFTIVILVIFLIKRNKLEEDIEDTELDEDDYPKALRKNKEPRGRRFKE